MNSLNSIDIKKEKWLKQKLMGKKKFILTHGVLAFASLSLLFSTASMLFNRGNSTNIQSIAMNYLTNIVIWSLWGIVYGNIFWNGNIKRFGK